MNLKQAINEFRASSTYKKQSEIHWFVWLIENPKSPLSLNGAVDLYNHDIIHILMGCGLTLQDEALVIGFTMGNSEKQSGFVKWLFLLCAKYLYPDGYRFGKKETQLFNRGYSYGLTRRKRNIHLERFNLSEMVNDIRKRFGIYPIDLRDYPNLSTY